MKYLSLFSGIGGFELGIHRVFPGAMCVGYSEIEPNAIAVYQECFPNHRNLGSVCEIRGNLGIDLLVGGSPCQDLSALRRMSKKDPSTLGLNGKKSSLFFEYVRILRENQPRHFILENVASMSKESRDEISRILGVQPVLLNSNTCSAQNRKRLFWCNFPVRQLTQRSRETMKDILVPVKIARTLQVPDKNIVSFIRRHGEEKLGKRISERGSIVNDTAAPKSYTLTCHHRVWVIDRRINDMFIRKLHPLEAERLQGFPDNHTNLRSRKLTNPARLKLCGNAVTVGIIAYICSELSKNVEL